MSQKYYFGTDHIFTSRSEDPVINIKAGAGEILNISASNLNIDVPDGQVTFAEDSKLVGDARFTFDDATGNLTSTDLTSNSITRTINRNTEGIGLLSTPITLESKTGIGGASGWKVAIGDDGLDTWVFSQTPMDIFSTETGAGNVYTYKNGAFVSALAYSGTSNSNQAFGVSCNEDASALYTFNSVFTTFGSKVTRENRTGTTFSFVYTNNNSFLASATGNFAGWGDINSNKVQVTQDNISITDIQPETTTTPISGISMTTGNTLVYVYTGDVFVFTYDGADWNQIQSFASPASFVNISVSKNILVIGTTNEVFVYERANSVHSSTFSFKTSFSYTGITKAVTNGSALYLIGTSSNFIKCFVKNGSDWIEINTLTDTGYVCFDIACSDNSVVVGHVTQANCVVYNTNNSLFKTFGGLRIQEENLDFIVQDKNVVTIDSTDIITNANITCGILTSSNIISSSDVDCTNVNCVNLTASTVNTPVVTSTTTLGLISSADVTAISSAGDVNLISSTAAINLDSVTNTNITSSAGDIILTGRGININSSVNDIGLTSTGGNVSLLSQTGFVDLVGPNINIAGIDWDTNLQNTYLFSSVSSEIRSPNVTLTAALGTSVILNGASTRVEKLSFISDTDTLIQPQTGGGIDVTVDGNQILGIDTNKTKSFKPIELPDGTGADFALRYSSLPSKGFYSSPDESHMANGGVGFAIWNNFTVPLTGFRHWVYFKPGYTNAVSPVDVSSVMGIKAYYPQVGLAIQSDTNITHNILNFYSGGGTLTGTVQQTSASTVSFITSSDRRAKKDIVDVTDCLSIINKLRVKKYKFKDDNYEQYGLLADEVDAIPEVKHLAKMNGMTDEELSECDKKCKQFKERKAKGEKIDSDEEVRSYKRYNQLDYIGMIPYLIGSINDLTDALNQEKSKVDSLVTRIESLEEFKALNEL